MAQDNNWFVILRKQTVVAITDFCHHTGPNAFQLSPVQQDPVLPV